MISCALKTIKHDQIGDNGILIFFGIDSHGYELRHIMNPPNPVDKFYYQCTKRFDTELFADLYTSKPIGNLVLIDGEICLMYRYIGKWEKLKAINANLVKRQKKGGQSSVRFSRLAEESRANYITHVVDWINKLIEPCQNNYVYGSREMKEMLLDTPEMKIKFKTDDMYHTFNEKTIFDPYFKNLITTPTFNDDKKVDNVVDLIQRDPDYLLFTKQEIMDHLTEIEYIINIHSDKKISSLCGAKSIDLPIKHHQYGMLCNFEIIAKLYVRKIDY